MSRDYFKQSKHDRDNNRKSSYHADKKKSHRRKNETESSSSSDSSSSEVPRKDDELYNELKVALEKHDHKEVYSIIKEISRTTKEELGILRVTIPNTFSFHKNDIEEFFSRFGRIENVIIKETKPKESLEIEKKKKQSENIAYIIFSQYFSAVIALKVLQSVSQKEKIVDAKICFTDDSIMQQQISYPVLGYYLDADFILEIQNELDLYQQAEKYQYFGTIGIDLQQKHFCLKDRIVGVHGCNFLRIYYLCEKAVRFENEGQYSQNDLLLKLISNKTSNTQRDVLVVSNNLLKYNTAIRYLHELLEQIVQEYKNSREKSSQIIPKDVHIRRWQKFKGEPILKFLEPKAS